MTHPTAMTFDDLEPLSEPHDDRTVKMIPWLRDAPGWLRDRIRQMGRFRGCDFTVGSDEDPGLLAGGTPSPTLPGAEVVSSRMSNHPDAYARNQHILAIDLDVPAILLPSSTPGHSHLIVDVLMDDEPWRALMQALSDAGVIEEGYAGASLRRGGAHLRLPWIRKHAERDDARRAMEEWLDADDEDTSLVDGGKKGARLPF